MNDKKQQPKTVIGTMPCACGGVQKVWENPHRYRAGALMYQVWCPRCEVSYECGKVRAEAARRHLEVAMAMRKEKNDVDADKR